MYCNPEEPSGYYNYSAEPYPPCDMNQQPGQLSYPPQSPGVFSNEPPRSPMFSAPPQAWNGHYGQAGGHPYYPQTAGYSFNFHIPVQQPWQPAAEMPKQPMQSLTQVEPPPSYESHKQMKKIEERKEESIRPESIQPNNQQPITLPESRPRGRPGRKPSTKASMPPADSSFLQSPEAPIKEKITRKRRRYETEEEKAASRRERNRLAQERSRMRTKERYDSLQKEMEKMKQDFTGLNGIVLDMLLTMHKHDMPEILATETFKDVIVGMQKLQRMYGNENETPIEHEDHEVDSCSEMSD